MEKPTLEQIAPYLPYGLKGILTTDKREDFACEDWAENETDFTKGAVWDLCGYAPGDLNIYIGEGVFDGFLWRKGSTYVNFKRGIKPILRPMDLTNPIILQGKEVVPICELCKNNYGSDYDGRDYDENELCDMERHLIALCGAIDTMYLNDALWLFKHKFDVLGLIEKGLAIDVNTLETNPYL